MQFEKICWICSSAKSLKMLSDSISEGLIFQHFLGDMPPDPLDLACFACKCVSPIPIAIQLCVCPLFRFTHSYIYLAIYLAVPVNKSLLQACFPMH